MPRLLAALALGAAASQTQPSAPDPIQVYIVPGGYSVNRVTVQSAGELVPLIPKDSDQPIQVRACGETTLGQLLQLVNLLSVEYQGRMSSNVPKSLAGQNGCP